MSFLLAASAERISVVFECIFADSKGKNWGGDTLKSSVFSEWVRSIVGVKYIISCTLASVGDLSAQPPNRHGVGAVTGSVFMTVQERLCLGMLFPGSRQV